MQVLWPPGAFVPLRDSVPIDASVVRLRHPPSAFMILYTRVRSTWIMYTASWLIASRNPDGMAVRAA